MFPPFIDAVMPPNAPPQPYPRHGHPSTSTTPFGFLKTSSFSSSVNLSLFPSYHSYILSTSLHVWGVLKFGVGVPSFVLQLYVSNVVSAWQSNNCRKMSAQWSRCMRSSLDGSSAPRAVALEYAGLVCFQSMNWENDQNKRGSSDVIQTYQAMNVVIQFE